MILSTRKGLNALQVNTNDVRGFFDSLAGSWDADRCADAGKIRDILRAADIVPGVRVLDVACGTGVLFPFYLECGAESSTGVDISPEMIRIARGKVGDSRIRLVCADVEEFEESGFDRIVVFNALPHFPDPERLIRSLAHRLAPGGRLTIAHDRCRAAVNGWHEQTASSVSMGLCPAEITAQWMGRVLNVDTATDGDDRYIVSGVKPSEAN